MHQIHFTEAVRRQNRSQNRPQDKQKDHGGGEYGEPYIHVGPVAVNSNKEAHNGMEHYKDLFMLYGRRFAGKAAELFG